MDRVELMSIAVSIADAGSLSAASRKLRMPVPTVSRKLSELEARLRTQLFNRSSRRLSLTEAGRSYVEACKRILEQEVAAARTAPTAATEKANRNWTAFRRRRRTGSVR